MSFDIEAYALGGAFLHWLTVLGSCLAIVLVVGVLLSLVVMGGSGPGAVYRQVVSGLVDITHLSYRRIWALTTLTFKESVRRKALLVFVVFAILFMFGGWFLADSGGRSDLQVKVYVSFVLTAVSWLILPVVLLLSCWGLPTDIKTRSLHTVVTKPARRNEIVLGRMLGFVAVGTMVLVLMGGVGYVWILRQVPQDARSALVSRVPIYGSLRYLDREGKPGEAINVGDIWEYRGYIEGATKARAIWDFEGVDSGRQGDSLILECRFEAFRTHKGEMDKSLYCQLHLVNVENKLPPVPLPAFELNEYGANLITIKRALTYYDDQQKEWKRADLFDDVISDGKLRIEAACIDPGQYLGMARPDLFVRSPDKPFASGYFKALFGSWLMMVLVVVLGVTASCFVKGPVATLLTFTLLVVGEGFREFLEKIVSGQMKSGGLFESTYRLLMHLNPQVPLDEGLATRLMQSADFAVTSGLWLVLQIIPDFTHFRMTPYVANGFDVDWNAALLPSITVTLAYLIPCLLIGHYSLKLRELEAK